MINRDLSRLKEGHSYHQLKLRFYELDVVIESDTSSFIDLFARMYPRFLTDYLRVEKERTATFTVYTQPDNPYGMPAIVHQGDVRILEDPKYLDGFAYEYIYYWILHKIKSHFLIHAGAVSYNDQGIVLAADSMHGKTTTVLKIIERGFKYLSDEIAALGRSDKLLYPFPRSLRIRPDTLRRAGFTGAAHKAQIWSDKLLMDIEDIKPGSMGDVVPLKWIIIFSEPYNSFSLARDQPERELYIFIDSVNENFLSSMNRIGEVVDLIPNNQNTCTRLSIRVKNARNLLTQIEEACQRDGIILYDISKKLERSPSFDFPARLEPIPHTQAVIELLRGLMGRHKSSLLQQEFSGSTKRMFLELASLISEAQCYRLYVGPLNQMADLICDLVGAN